MAENWSLQVMPAENCILGLVVKRKASNPQIVVNFNLNAPFLDVQHWSPHISFAHICEFGLAHSSFNFSNEYEIPGFETRSCRTLSHQHKPWTKKTQFDQRVVFQSPTIPNSWPGHARYICDFNPGDGRTAGAPRGDRTWALLWVDFKCCRESSVAGSAWTCGKFRFRKKLKSTRKYHDKSQMLHVWNIYLHLTQSWPKRREIFHTWSIWEWIGSREKPWNTIVILPCKMFPQ